MGVLAIQRINKLIFDRLKPCPSLVERITCNEVEWFTDDAETILGTISEGWLAREWGFVVWERDDRGVFFVCSQATGLPTLDIARAKLWERMDALDLARRACDNYRSVA